MRRAVLLIAGALVGLLLARPGPDPELVGHLGPLPIHRPTLDALAILDGVDPDDATNLHAVLVKHWLTSHLRAQDARALGLHADQAPAVAFVRRAAEDLVLCRDRQAQLGEPTDEDLRAAWEAHPERYVLPGHVDVVQAHVDGPIDAIARARVVAAMVETAEGRAEGKLRGPWWSVSRERVPLPAPGREDLAAALQDAPLGEIVDGPGGVLLLPVARTPPRTIPFDAARAQARAHLRAEREASWRAAATVPVIDARALAAGEDRVGRIGEVPLDLAFDRAVQLVHPAFHRAPEAGAYAALLLEHVAVPRALADEARRQGVSSRLAAVAAAAADLAEARWLAAVPRPERVAPETEATARAWYRAHQADLTPPATASWAIAVIPDPSAWDPARVHAALAATTLDDVGVKVQAGGATIAVERSQTPDHTPWGPLFRDADVGRTLGPVPRHGGGLVLLRVLERAAARTPTWEEARSTSLAAVRHDDVPDRLARYPWRPMAAP